MGRDVDERKKRAALRKLRKAAELAEQGKGPPLSDWERQFLEEVEERIEKYGSAFADPMKGNQGEALSSLQQMKLKEIDKKARGKARSGLKSKAGPKKGLSRRPPPRVRTVDEDVVCPQTAPPQSPDATPAPDGRKPVFRVIEGGKSGS